MKRSAKILAVLLSVVLLVGVLAVATFAMQPTLKIGTAENGIISMYFQDYTSYTGGQYTAKGDGQASSNATARYYNWGDKEANINWKVGMGVDFAKGQNHAYTSASDVNTFMRVYRDASADSTFKLDYGALASDAPCLIDFWGGTAYNSNELLGSHDFVTVDFDICADQYVDDATQDFVAANPDGTAPEGAHASWSQGWYFNPCFRINNNGTWAGSGSGIAMRKDSTGYYLSYSTYKYYLPNQINEWVHVTLVIDVDNSSNADIANGATTLGNLADKTKMYYYVNGEFFGEKTDALNSKAGTDVANVSTDYKGNKVSNANFEVLRISFADGGVAESFNKNSFSVGWDNYSVNYYEAGYEGDLADFTFGAGSKLYTCDDVVFNDNYKFPSNKPVATVESAEGDVEEYFFMSAALKGITEGSTVTLYENSTETYTVDFPFSVVTNGFTFSYTSETYEGNEVEDPTLGETIKFEESTNLIPLYWDALQNEDVEYEGPFTNFSEIANGNQIVYTGPTVLPVEDDPSKVYVLTGWTNTIDAEGNKGEAISLPVANSEEAEYYEFVALYDVVDVAYAITVGEDTTYYTDFDGYAANIKALAEGAIVDLYQQPAAIVDLAAAITVNVAEGVEFKFCSKTVTATNVEGVYEFAAATEADMVTVNWLDSDNTTILSAETFAKGSIAVYTGSTTGFKPVVTNNGYYNWGFTSMAPVTLLDPAVTYEGKPVMETPVEALEVLVSVNTGTTLDMRWLVAVPDPALGVTDMKIRNTACSQVDISNGVGDPKMYYTLTYGSPGASDADRTESATFTYKVNGVAVERLVQINHFQYFDGVIRNAAATEAEKTFVANAIRYFDLVCSTCKNDLYESGTIIAKANRTLANNILKDFSSYLIDNSYENLANNVFTEAELNVSLDELKTFAPWITKGTFVTDNWDAKYPAADQRGYRPRLAIEYSVAALNAAHTADPSVPNNISQSWSAAGLVMQNYYMKLETGAWSESRTLDKDRNLSDLSGNPLGIWYTDSGNQKLWNQRGVVKFRLGYVVADAEADNGLKTTTMEGTYSLAKNIVETEAAGEGNAIQRALYAFSMASEQFKRSPIN